MKPNIKSNEIVSQYLDKYEVTEPVVIKKPSKKAKENYTFYTDGTSRSYSGDKNTPGIGGFAWVRETEGSDQRHYYAWSFNGMNNDQIELQAIYSALRSVDKAANVRIVTDSKVGVELLTDHFRVNHLLRMTEDERSLLKGEDRNIANCLKYRDMILDELHNNKFIKGFEIEHVKSHAMDWGINKMIWTNHAPENDRLFKNIVGNTLADMKANDSIAFTLRKLADIHMSNKVNVRVYNDTPCLDEYKSIFKQYHYLKVLTLDYMAKKGVEMFPKEKVEAVFGDNGKTYSQLIKATSIWRQMDYADTKEERIKTRAEFNLAIEKKDEPQLFVDGKRISGYNSSLIEVSKRHNARKERELAKSQPVKPSVESQTESLSSERSEIAKKKAANFEKKFGRFKVASLNQSYLDKVKEKNNNNTLER